MGMMITDKKFPTSNEWILSRGLPRLPFDCPLPLPLTDWLTRFYWLYSPNEIWRPETTTILFSAASSLNLSRGGWMDGWRQEATLVVDSPQFIHHHRGSCCCGVGNFYPKTSIIRIEPKLGCLFNKTTLYICSWRNTKKKNLLTTTSIHPPLVAMIINFLFIVPRNIFCRYN